MKDHAVKRGVLYIAFGDGYRNECARSIRSLKEIHPRLPVCVITDEPWNLRPEPDMVLRRDAIWNVGAKSAYLGHSPFSQTLFLDTDTIIVRPRRCCITRMLSVVHQGEWFCLGSCR